MAEYKTTKDIKVPDKIVDQVIGQDFAVDIIKKAAEQRRHVLLIGEPGTGKSMLGLALADLLTSHHKLEDVLCYPNDKDPNQPLIKKFPAEEGEKTIIKLRTLLQSGVSARRFVLFLIFGLVILGLIYMFWQYKESEFAPFVILGGVFNMIWIFFMLSFLMRGAPGMFKTMTGLAMMPKPLVTHKKNEKAPFVDATGSHDGALLGDVLHDPFQTFLSGQWLQKVSGKKIVLTKINTELDSLFTKHEKKVLRKKKNNYEAVFIPDEEELFILGEDKGQVSPVKVLSSNRYDYEGEMIKITTSENKEIIITPEHKISTSKNGKVIYTEAKNIKKGNQVITQIEEHIIDEQDIINTYDERQQEQCKLYYQYLEIKKNHALWGYKRIAKAMNQPESKTRWWHTKRHIPVPIQTANWLKEKGLLPLKISNPKLHLIAKVTGATFGDGGIFENLNGIFLSSSELEAVKEFGCDLEKIFNLKEKENSRIIEGGEYGHSWCYQNTNRNIIRFFLALNAPKGKKTYLKFNIPNWIKQNIKLEDEFFGSFFGSEMGTPTIHKRGNFLTSLEVGITARNGLEDNRLDFFNQISEYLSNKKVNTSSIYTRRLNKDSTVYRLLIEKKMDNVLHFMINIKINYCKYKIDRLYKALGEWAQLKKDKYNELTERGYGAEHAMKVLNLTPNSLYLLLNHFGEVRT